MTGRDIEEIYAVVLAHCVLQQLFSAESKRPGVAAGHLRETGLVEPDSAGVALPVELVIILLLRLLVVVKLVPVHVHGIEGQFRNMKRHFQFKVQRAFIRHISAVTAIEPVPGISVLSCTLRNPRDSRGATQTISTLDVVHTFLSHGQG